MRLVQTSTDEGGFKLSPGYVFKPPLPCRINSAKLDNLDHLGRQIFRFMITFDWKEIYGRRDSFPFDYEQSVLSFGSE